MEKVLIIFIIIILIIVLIDICKIEGFDYIDYMVPPFKIDVVYTWAGENKNLKNPRLSFNDELKYSIRSVFKYAPWINKIYILMNPPKEKPSWFNENYKDRIVILDHTDTFEKENLPCTNSNSIETTLINIPNLSEHFIYFNDDVFLGNKVEYTDFFNED